MIKNVFKPIMDLLVENKDVKVSKILAQVEALASAKTGGNTSSTVVKDNTGKVVAILDYYFKRYMPLVGPLAVEFGVKTKTTSGLNTMCKEGVSAWTKQDREAKKARIDLFAKVKAREINVDAIDAEEARIEAEKKMIVPTTLGFATLEEVTAYLAEQGVILA